MLVGRGGPPVPRVVRDVHQEIGAVPREEARQVGEDRLVADEGPDAVPVDLAGDGIVAGREVRDLLDELGRVPAPRG